MIRIEIPFTKIPSDLKQYFKPIRKYGPWILRNNIIWHKLNPIPSSQTDRFTVDFENIMLFVQKKDYFFEQQFEPLKEISIKRAEYGWYGKKLKDGTHYNGISHTDRMGERFAPLLGRNKRTVWTISTKGFKDAHFATFCEELIESPISAGCPEFVCKKCGKPRFVTFDIKKEFPGSYEKDRKRNEEYRKEMGGKGDGSVPHYKREIGKKIYSNCGCNAGWNKGIVLDPFFGAGTVGVVALKQNKDFIGIELNSDYCKIAEERIKPFLDQKGIGDFI